MSEQAGGELDQEKLFRKLDTIIALLATDGKEDRRIKALKALGYTFEEVSAITGIPVGTLKTRYTTRL